MNHTEFVGKRLSTNLGVPGRLKKLQFSNFYEETCKIADLQKKKNKTYSNPDKERIDTEIGNKFINKKV